MPTDTLELIQYALTIMEKRATDEKCSVEVRLAYDSAICMICYALDGAYDNLAQFDY